MSSATVQMTCSGAATAAKHWVCCRQRFSLLYIYMYSQCLHWAYTAIMLVSQLVGGWVRPSITAEGIMSSARSATVKTTLASHLKPYQPMQRFRYQLCNGGGGGGQ